MTDYKSNALKYVDLKTAVADALIGISEPIRERKAELLADKKAIKNQIKAGSLAIRARAQQTVREVKELVGLLNVKA